MKERTRLFCAVLVSLSVLVPLSANGTSEETTTSGFSGTISFAAGTVEADGLKAVLKEYQKTNPNVDLDIIVTQTVTDFETLMTSWIASDSLPDMYLAQVGAVEQGYAENGYLLPLSDLGIADRLVAGDTDMCSKNGKLYAFPMTNAVSAILLNNDVLKKAGITITAENYPRNWSEFLALLDSLVDAGIEYPISLGGKDISDVTAWTFQYIYQVIYGEDPNWYADILRGKHAWNDELYLKMFEKYGQLLPYIAPSALGTDNNQMFKKFITGESPVFFQVATTVGNLRQIDPDLDIVCIPSCFTDDAADQTIIAAFDAGVSITSKAKQKDLCIDFMKFLTSDVGSTLFSNATGYLPTTKVNHAKIDPAHSILMEILQKGALPVSPILSRQWIPGIKEIMKSGQQNWFAGEDAQAVADRIEEQHTRLVDANPEWVKNFLATYRDK